MRPNYSDPDQQLALVKAHQEELRREWHAANFRKSRGSGPASRSALHQARVRVGVALIDLGRRLLPAERSRRRIAFERRPDWGC
jgi:hypothetical protein